MPIQQNVGRRFRVGLVVLIALFATMIGIFMIGQRANLFRKKFPYETRFDSASGLVAGNVVSLNGVVVGNVLEVNLSGDPADRTVRVVYDVVRRWAPMLRKGTRASIKTRGLLGDKYIELEGGRADEPEVPIGGEIPAAPGAGIEKLLAGSGDLLTDLSAIAKSLRAILGRTEKGEGFLGSITSNSPESEQLGNSFNAALRSLNSILDKINKGQGLAGRLLVDEKYGRETSESLAEAFRSIKSLVGRIDDQVRTGQGAIPALLSDPEGKKKVYALVDTLAATAASLARPPRTSRRATAPSRSCCTTSSSGRRSRGTSATSLRASTRSGESSMAAPAPPASSSTTPRSTTPRSGWSSAWTSPRSCAG